jgi:predicted ATPase
MFVLDIEGSTGGQSFEAASMSDGTLRALATLVASRQMISTALGEEPMQLIGIEEPETSLHPGATAALVEGLREATQHTQVLLTTHSADLLDHLDLERDQLLVVEGRRGVTSIAQADPASREAIAEHLYSAGELLRMDQLEPDAQDLERQAKSLVAADDR